jgi:hypothetical protein
MWEFKYEILLYMGHCKNWPDSPVFCALQQTSIIMQHVDPVLGNGTYTHNRGIRHIHGDIMQQ